MDTQSLTYILSKVKYLFNPETSCCIRTLEQTSWIRWNNLIQPLASGVLGPPSESIPECHWLASLCDLLRLTSGRDDGGHLVC